MKRNLGFTLVELMIVVGVMGILAAIAIPQYNSYLIKSKRADAKVALSSLAQMQESFFANNNRYTTILGTGGLNCQKKGVCNEDQKTTAPDTQDGKNYVLSIVVTGNAYTITAAANSTSQKRDDRCLSFSIDSRGQKTATNPDCW
jgi:type IV pilus assembly protein PilE